MQPANPRRPVPTKPMLAGSGTAAGGSGGSDGSAASAENFEKEASLSDCVAGAGGVIEVYAKVIEPPVKPGAPKKVRAPASPGKANVLP